LNERATGPTGRPRRNAPTITDVAQRAGVSRSLASLALRGSDLVSAGKRERILRAADELGYRPNAMARGLAERRSRLIGVLVSDLRNAFFSELAEQVDLAARQAGYRCVIAAGHRDTDQETEAVRSFVESRVDALAMLSPVLPEQRFAQFTGQLPVTVEGRERLGVPGIDTVSTDDTAGAALAVEHLVALGHRDIAHVSGGDAATGRRAGYETAMRAHGLGGNVETVATDESDAGGYEAARKLLGRGDPPTAVFAVNDVSALGVLAAADDLGVPVPDALSVVGYDDTYLAELRGVALTSVAQPCDLIAQGIVETLLGRIGDPDRAPVHRLVAPTLSIRSTTTAPAR
jgi:DNA-binding LacI/PurR family transcriptional regulator